MLNLLLLHNEPAAIERMLAVVLGEHHGAIVDLWGRGLHGSEAIFLFDRDDGGRDRVYDGWLRDLFSPGEVSPDKVLARLCLVCGKRV